MNYLRFSTAVLILLIVGTSTAGAFPGQTSACENCHALSTSIIVTANVTSTLTVNPGQAFTVGINYTGGLSTGKTEVNWPNVRNNGLFNPAPRVPVPAASATNGTTSSVLTAPLAQGSYDVRVYASSGAAATGADGTNFTDINITVKKPQILNDINLTVDMPVKTTFAGINSTYILTLNNSGTVTDNYTLTIDNPDNATIAVVETNLVQNLDPGANTAVLLNVTNATQGKVRVNVTATSMGDPTRMASANTTTTVNAKAGLSWHVLAGGETSDMKIQGMGFYPGIITINEGDEINWTLGGSEFHTVSFLSGDPIPEPGSIETLLPAGGFEYNGTGHASSGLIMPGKNYILKFTKPGIYIYRCLIHPGMGGVVIVQTNGSSYPFTQDQYTAQGLSELNADLTAGQQLVDNLNLSSAPGPNGTTIWQAAADISLSVKADVVLSQKNNSDANGSATMNLIGPGMLEVRVQLSGLAPNSVHPAHIYAGSCEAGGSIEYMLNNLTADAQGNATNTTIINGPPWLSIQRKGLFVNVHQGPAMSDGGAAPIACGDVEKNYASYMRFAPDPLRIHTNDTVVWTQLNFMMIHTVTFPNAGQPIPEFILPDLSINPAAAAPAGGRLYNGTGFFNSGALMAGQNYTLTFTKPGIYEYLCLIHDEIGMKGKVIVLPSEGQINLVSDVPNLARITDPNLVNPWGMARSPTGPWWIADNGMGVSTVYNGTGRPFPPNNPIVATVPVPQNGTPPSSPTGIVYNGGSGFEVAPGKPARFIFVTEDGTISGWNSSANSTSAILKVDNSPNAVYKGVTIAQKDNESFLFVANFSGGSVDVFDDEFNPVGLAAGAFTDNNISPDFAPFNVQNINGRIFVSFAKQDTQKHDNLDGTGLGFVDVFDTGGNLSMRLEHGDWMNAPWGIALAPSDFSGFGGDLLVGNFGSGQIAAFDHENGTFHGILKNPDGKAIIIDGLWGLGFGNGATAGPNNTLYFTAGINDEAHGLFGIIQPVTDIIKPVINSVILNNRTPNTGDAILVTVNATDNVGVTNVMANGVSLIYKGGNIWNGNITARAGTHQVNVSAIDAAGNIAINNSTSYTATPPAEPTGSISGMKFNDSNGNRTRDPEESGLSTWTIVLKNSTGAIVESMMTDIDGNYTFDGLAAGNYTVEEVLQTGWMQTFPETPGVYNVMLTSGENLTGIDFGNILRLPLQSEVNATRQIQKESLRLGESTNITVTISSGSVIQALALQELIPAGWKLTRISDDADGFKNSTNEWAWSNVTGITRIVYSITAPADAAIGTYYINGTISNSSGVIAIVGGGNIITLDIVAYYRRLGSYPDRVETTDLLKAMDDWRSRTAPAGFKRSLNIGELMALINEWAWI